jgi:hypothetical protein
MRLLYTDKSVLTKNIWNSRAASQNCLIQRAGWLGKNRIHITAIAEW